MFHLIDSQVWSNRTNGEGYAIELVDADGEIDGLVVNGENNGIYWEGRNLVSTVSPESFLTYRFQMITAQHV